MHIIARPRLDEAAEIHPNSRSAIHRWYGLTRKASWGSLVETRESFPHADQIKVSSGKIVTIFNLKNSYRLVTAIHYNHQKVFILRVLTHAEYDQGRWKETL